ncbi:hypothetical protein NQ315_003459, partial [Exocentrus adspersus]
MPLTCCIPYCKANCRTRSGPVTVFSFPKDEKLKQKWLTAIGGVGVNLIPTQHSKVCIEHFCEGDIRRTAKSGKLRTIGCSRPLLKKGTVPSVFPNPSHKIQALHYPPVSKECDLSKEFSSIEELGLKLKRFKIRDWTHVQKGDSIYLIYRNNEMPHLKCTVCVLENLTAKIFCGNTATEPVLTNLKELDRLVHETSLNGSKQQDLPVLKDLDELEELLRHVSGFLVQKVNMELGEYATSADCLTEHSYFKIRCTGMRDDDVENEVEDQRIISKALDVSTEGFVAGDFNNRSFPLHDIAEIKVEEHGITMNEVDIKVENEVIDSELVDRFQVTDHVKVFLNTDRLGVSKLPNKSESNAEIPVVNNAVELKDPLEIRWFKCDSCDYKTRWKRRLEKHMVVHKEINLYKCDWCDFKTKWKALLNSHVMEFHNNDSEIKWYKCDFCDYRSKRQTAMRSHVTLNHNRSCRTLSHKQTKRFQCTLCNYRSNWKYAIRKHASLEHNEDSKIKWYKCDLCPYKTKYRSSLRTHKLVHMDDSEIKWFHCHLCEYRSKYKYHFKSHIQRHINASKVEDVKCDLCEFKTKSKAALKIHESLDHKDPVQTLYKCAFCDHETNWKRSLETHLLTHKDASQVEWYRCGLCDFKTKWKHYLTTHSMVHKKPEPKLYKCEFCDCTINGRQNLRIHKLNFHKDEVIWFGFRLYIFYEGIIFLIWRKRYRSWLQAVRAEISTGPKYPNYMDNNNFGYVDIKVEYDPAPAGIGIDELDQQPTQFARGETAPVTEKFNESNSLLNGIKVEAPDKLDVVENDIKIKIEAKETDSVDSFQSPDYVHVESLSDIEKVGVPDHSCKIKTDVKSRSKEDSDWDTFLRSLSRGTSALPASVQEYLSKNEHTSTYKDPPEVEWLKCGFCEYKTKVKGSLKYHMFRHMDESEITWLECSYCHYKTARKSHLVTHMHSHKDPSEIYWYKCKLCDYKTNRRYSLKQHCCFKHKNRSEIDWHKCDLCSYKCKWKTTLSRHVLQRHDNPASIEWYKCYLCDFKSEQKGNLRRHLLTHKNVSKTKWYKCDVCDYKTVRSDRMRRHKFPKNKERRNSWLAILGISESMITNYTVVCSDHFRENDFILKPSGLKYLRESAVPVPPGTSSTQSEAIPPIILTHSSSDLEVTLNIERNDDDKENISMYYPCDISPYSITESDIKASPSSSSSSSTISAPETESHCVGTYPCDITSSPYSVAERDIKASPSSSSSSTISAPETERHCVWTPSPSTVTVSKPEDPLPTMTSSTPKETTRVLIRKRRYPIYFGDCRASDMDNPKHAKRNWEIADRKIRTQARKIRNLQQSNRRLRSRIHNLNSLVEFLQRKLSAKAESPPVVHIRELEHDNTENNVNDDEQITLSQSLTRDENVSDYPLMEDNIKVEEQEILSDEGVIKVKEEQMEVLERLDSFELTNHVAVLEENELGAYYNYEIHCKSEIDSEFVESAIKEDPDGVIFLINSSINPEASTSSTHILTEQHDSPSLLLDDKFVSNNCKSNREDMKNQLKVHNTDSTKVKWYRCNSCDHQTKRKDSLEAHMLLHKDPSQLTWYECNSCGYKAKEKRRLKIHMLAHKDPSQLKWFECNSCDYKAKHKDYLKRHMMIHKDPSEVTWYHCDLCSFKTKRQRSLKGHIMLVHENTSDKTWYKCDLCNYKSRRKSLLECHVVIHKNASKINGWYKCNLCDYKSTSRSSINYHMFRHKDSSEIKWYKCDLCDFKAKRLYVLKNHVESVHEKTRSTKRLKRHKCDVCDYRATAKAAIRYHMVLHQDASDIIWYNCDTCDYKSKWKSCLRSHVLTHKDRSAIRLFKCDLCDYKTKWKADLKKHVLIHTDDSEIEWNKCDVCDFKTKWKPNLKAHNKSFHHKITPTVECEWMTMSCQSQTTLSESPSSDEIFYECYPLMEDSIKIEEHEILTDEDVIKVKEEEMEILEPLDCFESTNHVAVLKENDLGAYYNYEIHCKSEIDSEFVESAIKEDPDGVIFLRNSSINPEASTSSTHILTEQRDPPSVLLDDKFVSNNCKSNREDMKNRMEVHNTDSTKVKWYSCNSCDHQTKRKYSLKAHMLVHKDPSQLTWYECNSCGYKAKQKRRLKAHMLIHKDYSQLPWNECNSCDYKTKQKHNLKRHLLIHKDPSEVTWYKCDSCSFKTKRKESLNVHMFVHKSNSDITWHKCDLCDHKTTRISLLERHMVVHKDASGSGWYKCDLCDCKYPWSSSLRYHMLSHKDSSEIKWFKCGLCDYKAKRRYVLRIHVESVHKKIRSAERLKEYKCDVCDYKTTGKSAIRSHMVIHKDPSDVDWYNCDSCDYKTKWKSCLTSHVLIHQDVSALRMYKCDFCDYKAKWKSYLKKHVLVHKDNSEIKWNKCDVCDFKTKWKPNLRTHN